MTHAAMERLLSTTTLLGLASLAAYFGAGAWLDRLPGIARARQQPGQRWGMLAFTAVLGFASGMMTLTMRYSPDPAEHAAPVVVWALVAVGTALGGLRGWAATHRNPAVRDGVDRFIRAAASRAALASLVTALGLMGWWLQPVPAGLAGFLLAVLAMLGWAAGCYFVRFGWRAAWWRGLTPIFMTPGPAQPAGMALRDGWREYLALTPKARSALKDACLAPWIASFAGGMLLFAPAGMLMNHHGNAATRALEVVFGLMGGAIFVLLLPAALLMGFAFAFILMPLGLLRTAGGASGGAGATGEL